MNNMNDRLQGAIDLADTIARVREDKSLYERLAEDAAYSEEVDSPYAHPLYAVLMGMLARCNDSEDKSYRWYGAKGITVCDKWTDDHKSFVTWGSSNGWKPGLQIDRIDSSKGYCPSNCRFVTQWDNIQNKKPENERIPQPSECGDRGKSYCTGCKQWHNLDAFYISNGRVSSACKACACKHKRDTYVSQRKNPLLTAEEKRKRYNEYQKNYRRMRRSAGSGYEVGKGPGQQG